MGRPRRLLIGLTCAGLLGAAGVHCGSSGAPSGAGASGGGGASGGSSGQGGKAGKGGHSGGATAGSAGSGTAGYPGDPFADWEVRNDFEGCPYRTPGLTGTMPPPLKWGPCTTKYWTIDKGLCETVDLAQYDFVDAESVHDSFVQVSEDEWYFAAVRKKNVEGVSLSLSTIESTKGSPVLAMRSETCPAGFYGVGLSGGWGISFYPEDKSIQGIVAGHWGEVYPSLVRRAKYSETSLSSNWDIVEAGVVEWRGGRILYPWSDPENGMAFFSFKDDLGGLSGYRLVGRGDASFIEVSGGGAIGMDVRTSEGVKPFLRYVPDSLQKGAGGLATDGKVLVWTYGEGATGQIYLYQKADMMVAPYTTDGPTALKTAKRVRSDNVHMTTYGWRVGCGYAANEGGGGGATWLRIVRLSDGFAWDVSSVWNPDPKQKMALLPLGVTCEHVYAIDPGGQIARIRIDSLGPGTPPD